MPKPTWPWRSTCSPVRRLSPPVSPPSGRRREAGFHRPGRSIPTPPRRRRRHAHAAGRWRGPARAPASHVASAIRRRTRPRRRSPTPNSTPRCSGSPSAPVSPGWRCRPPSPCWPAMTPGGASQRSPPARRSAPAPSRLCTAANRARKADMSPNRFRKTIALDRAYGVTLWQVILLGDALRETLVLFTEDPVRICEAFWKGNLEAPRWRQRSPGDLRTLPVPPVAEDMDEEEPLRVVRALQRDRFFTTSELTARGICTFPYPYEATTLARHLTMGSEAAEVPMLGARFATASREALLGDLAAVARLLSHDELRVLVTIAVRTRGGQSRYGRLRLAHDNRDFRREALEEACDGCFYLAAGLVRASEGTRRLRGRRRDARG